jgi:dephospho-CoA kinase
MECALLFESGFDQLVHRSILVSAPLEKRIARVIQRDGASKTKVEEWIALQMPEEEKARRAHYIIYNEYTPDFQESLCALLEDRIKI